MSPGPWLLPCPYDGRLCCGSSVAALKGSLAIQSSSSSKMIIQIGKPKKNRNQAPEGQTNLKNNFGVELNVNASAD
jgi:hypothetical protein